jgi:hypothetical protein
MMGILSTPQAHDLYSRYFVDSFNEKTLISVPTAFQTWFGNEASGSRTIFSEDALTVDIDIIRGNEKISALIPRGGIARTLGNKQKNLNVQKSTAFARVFPLSEEEGDLNANQILRRLAGEAPTERRRKLARMRALARDLHEEQVRRTIRLFEVLASQSILYGTQDAILGTANPDEIYDFHRNPTHRYNAPVKWDVSGVDIMAQIDGALDLGRKDAFTNLDMIVLGADVCSVYQNDEGIRALADNRRFELIQVGATPVPPRYQRFVDNGMTALGRARTPKGREVWFFTYNDGYGPKASWTPYMPVNKVLFASSQPRCDRYFGPAERLPVTPSEASWYQEMFGFNMAAAPMPPRMRANGTIRPDMFHFDAYMAEDKKSITTRCQSAPIFATTQTDAFVLMEEVV